MALGCALLVVALAACESGSNNAPPPLPSGTYTSAAYHFSVKYPTGWTAIAIGCAGTQATGSGCAMLGGTATSSEPVASPLQVTITHTAQRTTTAASVSTFSITVLDLSIGSVATPAAAIAQDTGLHAITLAGLPAYASTPTQQGLPGANGTTSSTVVDTHSDYYLVHGGYEYLISVDSLSDDKAGDDLKTMLASFTITA